MKNGYYTTMIHGWLDFFKIEDGKVLCVETGKKSAWYPTLICQKREESLKPITIEEAKAAHPDLVTQNQKASDEDIFGSIKSAFAEKRMSK
jgi:hypothetical protein